MIGLGTVAITYPQHHLQLSGLVALAGGFLFYGTVQIRWLHQELGQSLLRSFFDASIGMMVSICRDDRDQPAVSLKSQPAGPSGAVSPGCV